MKVTIELNLDKEEDSFTYALYNLAPKLKYFLDDFSQHLRSVIKNESDPHVLKIYKEISEKFYEYLNDYDLLCEVL